MDMGFSGWKYTLSNNIGINQMIWKRLDRWLINDNWLENMPESTITHLFTTGSDHCPLLLEIINNEGNHTEFFKFLNCWVDKHNILGSVKTFWEREVKRNSMLRFHHKMKKLSNCLSKWSKQEYWDISKKGKEFEAWVEYVEENLMQHNNIINRESLHEFNAQSIRYLKLEDTIMKQHSQLYWFKEGDSKSKFFHSLIRGRRRRLFIQRIYDKEELFLGDENIGNAAC